jgi:hypothetical protein
MQIFRHNNFDTKVGMFHLEDELKPEKHFVLFHPIQQKVLERASRWSHYITPSEPSTLVAAVMDEVVIRARSEDFAGVTMNLIPGMHVFSSNFIRFYLRDSTACAIEEMSAFHLSDIAYAGTKKKQKEVSHKLSDLLRECLQHKLQGNNRHTDEAISMLVAARKRQAFLEDLLRTIS